MMPLDALLQTDYSSMPPLRSVLALHDAISMFGHPATILSDNGSCFVGPMTRKREKPKMYLEAYSL